MDDLGNELLELKRKMGKFSFGFSQDLVQDLNLHLERILANFESKGLKDKMFEFDKLKTVCPETFQGTTYGYPLYKSGFTIGNCRQPYKIQDLVTILYNFVAIENVLSDVDVTNLVNMTLVSHPGVKIKLATHCKLPKFKNVELLKSKEAFKESPEDITDGMIWNALIQDVKTPYVYIGQDTYTIDEFSVNFERMVIVLCLFTFFWRQKPGEVA